MNRVEQLTELAGHLAASVFGDEDAASKRAAAKFDRAMAKLTPVERERVKVFGLLLNYQVLR